jgi:hypothetical protein
MMTIFSTPELAVSGMLAPLTVGMAFLVMRCTFPFPPVEDLNGMAQDS